MSDSAIYIVGWEEPDRTMHYRQFVGPRDAGRIPWAAVTFFAENIEHSDDAWLFGACP